ncbi:hypothetical protein [Cupriavidus necator]|uniref:hypothetical protein n=1 Tax=Cupriavidus necator TaxID=106590 RepID=UPI0030F4A169
MLLLGGTVGVGAALTLVTWPKDAPASGGWFWTCLLAFPVLAWMILLGLRLYIQDLQINYARDRNRRRKERLLTETQRGQRSIAVMASAYETAMGKEDLGEILANGGDGMQSILPVDGGEPVRYSVLPEVVRTEKGDVASLTALFRRILERMAPQLHTMPRGVPVHVRLQASAGSDLANVEQAWRDASAEYLLATTSLQLVEANSGLLLLDQWLDVQEAGRDAFLVFAFQIRVAPLNHTGEAVAALLLTRNAKRWEIPPLASLHRPVSFSQGDLSARLADAILWGKHAADQIGGLWTGGMDVASLNAVTAAASQAKVGSAIAEGLAHFDVDTSLGQTGLAAGWLAAAAAAERCHKEERQQLVAVSENGHQRMLVVAPAET